MAVEEYWGVSVRDLGRASGNGCDPGGGCRYAGAIMLSDGFSV